MIRKSRKIRRRLSTALPAATSFRSIRIRLCVSWLEAVHGIHGVTILARRLREARNLAQCSRLSINGSLAMDLWMKRYPSPNQRSRASRFQMGAQPGQVRERSGVSRCLMLCPLRVKWRYSLVSHRMFVAGPIADIGKPRSGSGTSARHECRPRLGRDGATVGSAPRAARLQLRPASGNNQGEQERRPGGRDQAPGTVVGRMTNHKSFPLESRNREQ